MLPIPIIGRLFASLFETIVILVLIGIAIYAFVPELYVIGYELIRDIILQNILPDTFSQFI